MRKGKEFLNWFDSLDYEEPRIEIQKKKENSEHSRLYALPKHRMPSEVPMPKKKIITQVATKTLPRVATLSQSIPKNNENTVKEHPLPPLIKSVIKLRNSVDFWRYVDMPSLLKAIGLVPVIVFDFGDRIVKWACFNEQNGSYENIDDMSSDYTSIVQSLCYFESSPLAVLKTTNEEPLHLFSKQQIIVELERLSKLFKKRCRGPQNQENNNLVIVQAYFPSNEGRILTISNEGKKNKLTSSIQKCCCISDAAISIAIESSTKSKWLLDVLEFNQSRKFIKPRCRNMTDAVVPKWCIGDFCKADSLNPQEITRSQDGEKKQVVYKMVLQHRTSITDSKELSEFLPANRRARMYETVKVCTLCFDELWRIENQRLEQERLVKHRLKEIRIHKKLKRTYSKAAELAAEKAKDRQDQERRKNRDFEKHRQTLQLSCEALIVLKHAIQEKNVIARQKAKDLELDVPCTELDPEKSKPVAPPVETVSFTQVTCSLFFGDDISKLSLCQGIMDTLRSGKNAQVSAPLNLNSDSEEECRLVLRSLYLEFRGMCVDQGFFPHVPIDQGCASMLLETLHDKT